MLFDMSQVFNDCDGMMPQLQLTEGVGVVINKADKEIAMKILESVKGEKE